MSKFAKKTGNKRNSLKVMKGGSALPQTIEEKTLKEISEAKKLTFKNENNSRTAGTFKIMRTDENPNIIIFQYFFTTGIIGSFNCNTNIVKITTTLSNAFIQGNYRILRIEEKDDDYDGDYEIILTQLNPEAEAAPAASAAQADNSLVALLDIQTVKQITEKINDLKENNVEINLIYNNKPSFVNYSISLDKGKYIFNYLEIDISRHQGTTNSGLGFNDEKIPTEIGSIIDNTLNITKDLKEPNIINVGEYTIQRIDWDADINKKITGQPAKISIVNKIEPKKGGGRTLQRNLMRKSKRNKKRKRTKNKKRNNKGRNSRKRT